MESGSLEFPAVIFTVLEHAPNIVSQPFSIHVHSTIVLSITERKLCSGAK
jgi:hypothetical protein